MKENVTGTFKAITRPLQMTLVGLWAERFIRSFWPLWTVIIATLSALAFGLQDWLPIEIAWTALILAGLTALGFLWRGLRQFHCPTRTEALVRLDQRLPGRPLAALTDKQAMGSDDPASLAVWQVHRARMSARAACARAVEPDLRLSSRDPFALRYVALTAFIMAMIFGSLWRVTSIETLAPGSGTKITTEPTWEGWAQPPSYTGKPTIYLNEVDQTSLDLPIGTRLQFRLYSDVGDLTLSETVSQRTEVPAASGPVHDLILKQSGKVSIDGPGGRDWTFSAIPDSSPSVTPDTKLEREVDGKLKQKFKAKDDYGILSGQVSIMLDLPGVQRIYGLKMAPEPREPVVLDLPMPLNGSRAEFTETLVDDLSKHPFANLPVTMTFQVTDAASQQSNSEPLHITLPGKRFFDPFAAALVEMRRDLLWNHANAPRVAQILKAITNHPEGLIHNERAYLRLRALIRDLDTQAATLSPESRDTFTEELWQIALILDEGDLTSALENLRRAQDRLNQAIKNGADKSEKEQLMKELRQAMNNYMRQLAQKAEKNPDQQQSQNMKGIQMSAAQLQQMLDELQKLMEEGKTTKAQQLMELLRQMMENMKVVQSQGGPDQQAMRDLQDTLRKQQGLSDDAFSDLQNGQEGGNDESQDLNGNQSLTNRQRELHDRLSQLQSGRLPGDGTKQGEEGRRQLKHAERAMNEAENALRDGNLPQALDRQAEAIEAIRNGMQNFGDALAENKRSKGEGFDHTNPNGQRDPLGRKPSDSAQIESDGNMQQKDNVYRRAQDLLNEIRRRSSEQLRREGERNYLRRLLDMF
ncbi:MAG: DUF4175 domain-containing protein [Rhodobacteraceae bacterium]|nr:DUF4175 domain-containing protein [Paracoccaceae bacterium]